MDKEGGHDSGYEVDGYEARGNRRGEGERDDHENTLPLVGRVSGQVRLYEERGRGGVGGKKRDGHHNNREGTRASKQQARYPGDNWQRDERLTTIARGAVSRAPQESRGNSSVQRPARYPGDAWQKDERLKTIAGGDVS